MKIKLSKEEAEKYFHSALCNGGITLLTECGVDLIVDNEKYKEAKESLLKKKADGLFNETICLEDVYMEMLKLGNSLRFVDTEFGGEYTREVTLKMVHKNTEKTPIYHLTNYINEEDDGITAFILLQSVMYNGKIIFA